MKPAVAPWQRPLYAMRIECHNNGPVVRIVEYPYDISIGGDLYRNSTGYSFTGIQGGTNMTPGVIDLTALVGAAPEITIPTIQAGIFDHARVYVFCTDWANPVEDEEQVALCIFGKVKIEDDKYITECMTLIDLLNTPVGDSYSALCSLVFGGQEYGGCKIDLGPLTVMGTLTAVVSQYEFEDSSRTEPDDYFGAGDIYFTTGANEGVPRQRVKAFTSVGGVIETTEPFPFPPEVGDEYVMIPGCRKRLIDCRDKWDNVPRRRGFDWVPGQRFLNRIGGNGQ